MHWATENMALAALTNGSSRSDWSGQVVYSKEHFYRSLVPFSSLEGACGSVT